MATKEIEIAPETQRDKRNVASLDLMEKGEGVRSMVVVIEAAEKANCDFTEVTEEENGALKYECNMCKKRFTQARGVKQHITSAHLKKEVKVIGLGKRKSVADFDDEDAKKIRIAAEAGFSKSIMDRWDTSELVCSTQVGLDDLYKEYVDTEEEAEMDEGEDEPPAENNTFIEITPTQDDDSEGKVELDEAKGEIRNLKEQLENKETTIAEIGLEVNELKESIKTKDDIINWNSGRVNELEGSLMAKNRETEKQMKVLNIMNAQIKATQETADVKKHKKEIAAKNKVLEDMNGRLAEAMKSVRDERNMRAKAEADLLTIRTVNESMKAVMLVQQQQQQQWSASQGAGVHPLTSQHGNQTVQQEGSRTEDGRGNGRKQILCRDINKPGGCRYKERCQFFHPPGSNEAFSQPSLEGKPDCSYWMDGHCKIPEERCKGKHDPLKYKTKVKILKQTIPDVNNQDFVQTLVGALSQALTGVQQQVQVSMAPSPPPARGQKQPGAPAFTLQQQGQGSGAPVLGQQQPGVPAFRQQHQLNTALGQERQMMFPQMGQQMIQPTTMPTMPSMFYPTQQQQWGGQSSSNQ